MRAADYHGGMTIAPSSDTAASLARDLAQLDPREGTYATQFVERLLSAACARQASDLHLTPSAQGLVVRWRVDGVLEEIGTFPSGEATDIVARLKVLADLLTYRQELPQEGRLRAGAPEFEMRLSTFPTLYGERAVVRIFRQARQLERLADLGLPDDIEAALRRALAQTSGAILITGPAGSGKTTTAYAALRELAAHDVPRSIITLEDPIEAVLPAAAQAAIQPAAGFDFPTALRSLMRQDPEVILLGEVRDRDTALSAFRAALTGHLVLTTFHAGNAAGAISRLNDMGIEPYLLRSGVQAIIGQRLVRRLCTCSAPSTDPAERLGLDVPTVFLPRGCDACAQTGYAGRRVLAEMLPPLVEELGTAVLERRDAHHLDAIARRMGMESLWQRAAAAVAAGHTSPAEIRRVLGIA